MKLRWMILSSLGFGLSTLAALGQVGIYGKFDYTRYTDHSYNTTTSFNGPGLGVYDDFIHLGPLRAGLDLRGAVLFGKNLRYREVLAGPRVALKLPLLPIKPFAQVSLGVGGTEATGPLAAGISSTHYNNKFLYEVTGGVDFTVLPHLDLRAVELGYGRVSGVNGGAANNPNSTLFTVSSGVVLRL